MPWALDTESATIPNLSLLNPVLRCRDPEKKKKEAGTLESQREPFIAQGPQKLPWVTCDLISCLHFPGELGGGLEGHFPAGLWKLSLP